MILKITEIEDVYFLEGIINKETALYLKNYFEDILYVFNTLTIDIEKVTRIDIQGIDSFKKLYKNAKLYDRKFYIVGNGCKEIFDELLFNSVA